MSVAPGRLRLALLVLTLSATTAAAAPEQTGRTVAIAERDGVLVRRVLDTGTFRDAERVRTAAPTVPGRRAALASFGGRRHLYYSRRDGSIGHLVSARGTDAPAWKDDGRVVASGTSPALVLDGDEAPWLVYDSADALLAVRIGPETGRIAIPLVAMPVGPSGPFVVARHGGALWLLRRSGPWIVAGPVLAKESAAPERIGLAPADWSPVGIVTLHGADAVVESGEEAPVTAPLVWPGADAPLLGDRGTLDSWIGEAPDPERIPGPWLHRVDDHAPGWLEFETSGRVLIPDVDVRWQVDGRDLLLTWPLPSAPGGAWRDRCRLSSDGTCYLGRNQLRNLIRGTAITPGGRLAVDGGSFEEVAAIALGKAKGETRNSRALRRRAIECLPRFADADWRAVLRALTDDPDASIRRLAERVLETR